MSKKVKKKKELAKSEHLERAASVIGALGSIAAIHFGAKRIGVRQRHAEWGFLLGGAAVALATKGWVRGAATGAASAGALSLAVSWLRERQEKRNANATVAVKRKRTSWWGDLITRDELERALADSDGEAKREDVTEEQRARIAKVRSRLTPTECGRFDAIVQDASNARQIYAHLLRLPTAEGVRFIRNRVLRGEL
jgi:hypothetical protein